MLELLLGVGVGFVFDMYYFNIEEKRFDDVICVVGLVIVYV